MSSGSVIVGMRWRFQTKEKNKHAQQELKVAKSQIADLTKKFRSPTKENV
jgi:hypothetical protein